MNALQKRSNKKRKTKIKGESHSDESNEWPHRRRMLDVVDLCPIKQHRGCVHESVRIFSIQPFIVTTTLNSTPQWTFSGWFGSCQHTLQRSFIWMRASSTRNRLFRNELRTILSNAMAATAFNSPTQVEHVRTLINAWAFAAHILVAIWPFSFSQMHIVSYGASLWHFGEAQNTWHHFFSHIALAYTLSNHITYIITGNGIAECVMAHE